MRSRDPFHKDVKHTDAATNCVASEIRVERRRVKCLSKPAQKGERANVHVCVIIVHAQAALGEKPSSIPVPDFSAVTLEEMAARIASQQSSTSGA